MHETIPGRHEKVLHENRALVPVDDLRCDPIRSKRSDEPSIANRGGSLHNGAPFADDRSIETTPLVEIGPSKVDFTKIASVVHVKEERVQVVGEADAWNGQYVLSST